VNDEDRHSYLMSFLARKGRSIDELKAQVGRSFGEPRLIVAAGSVLQGFGNAESDLDVIALVDAPQVTDIPIPSHVLGLPVDVNYLDTEWIQAAAAQTMAAFTPDVLGHSQAQWRSAYRSMTKTGRLVYGLALAGDPALFDWQRELRATFPRYAVAWWRAECLRQRTANRLIRPGRPMLAAHRGHDAGMAALESLVSPLDEAYTGPKWIGAKLRRVSDPALNAAYERLVRLPRTDADALSYLDNAEQAVARLLASAPLPEDPWIAVSLHDGTERITALGQVLVHRHGGRGVQSSDPAFGVAGEDGLLFSGPVSALPGSVRVMLTEGVAWMTVREAPAY
jgi:hypothetical protein